MNDLSETMKEKSKKKLIQWRRSQIIEYSSKGFSNAAISRALHISEPTVSRDLAFLKDSAKKNIVDYTDNFCFLYSQTIDGLNAILREAWIMASQREIDMKDKSQALSLAMDCYNLRMNLLTNVTVVDDVIKFIDNHKKKQQNNQKTINNNQNNYNKLDNNNNDSKQERKQEVYEHQHKDQEQSQEQRQRQQSQEQEIVETSTTSTTEAEDMLKETTETTEAATEEEVF